MSNRSKQRESRAETAMRIDGAKLQGIDQTILPFGRGPNGEPLKNRVIERTAVGTFRNPYTGEPLVDRYYYDLSKVLSRPVVAYKGPDHPNRAPAQAYVPNPQIKNNLAPQRTRFHPALSTSSHVIRKVHNAAPPRPNAVQWRTFSGMNHQQARGAKKSGPSSVYSGNNSENKFDKPASRYFRASPQDLLPASRTDLQRAPAPDQTVNSGQMSIGNMNNLLTESRQAIIFMDHDYEYRPVKVHQQEAEEVGKPPQEISPAPLVQAKKPVGSQKRKTPHPEKYADAPKITVVSEEPKKKRVRTKKPAANDDANIHLEIAETGANVQDVQEKPKRKPKQTDEEKFGRYAEVLDRKPKTKSRSETSPALFELYKMRGKPRGRHAPSSKRDLVAASEVLNALLEEVSKSADEPSTASAPPPAKKKGGKKIKQPKGPKAADRRQAIRDRGFHIEEPLHIQGDRSYRNLEVAIEVKDLKKILGKEDSAAATCSRFEAEQNAINSVLTNLIDEAVMATSSRIQEEEGAIVQALNITTEGDVVRVPSSSLLEERQEAVDDVLEHLGSDVLIEQPQDQQPQLRTTFEAIPNPEDDWSAELEDGSLGIFEDVLLQSFSRTQEEVRHVFSIDNPRIPDEFADFEDEIMVEIQAQQEEHCDSSLTISQNLGDAAVQVAEGERIVRIEDVDPSYDYNEDMHNLQNLRDAAMHYDGYERDEEMPLNNDPIVENDANLLNNGDSWYDADEIAVVHDFIVIDGQQQNVQISSTSAIAEMQRRIKNEPVEEPLQEPIESARSVKKEEVKEEPMEQTNENISQMQEEAIAAEENVAVAEEQEQNAHIAPVVADVVKEEAPENESS